MRVARLMIERFRGVEFLPWDPSEGINCIVGPADAGKSTVLAAIELLLAPWQPVLFEFDFWRRRVDEGFQISAILLDLPDDFVASFRVPLLHGWIDGRLIDLPEDGAVPAMFVAVRGLPDLEVEHVLIDPSGGETRIPLGQRRQLRATRLNWDRTDIELRLSRGSLLQQHLGGQGMRPALTGALAETSERIVFPPDVSKRLKALGEHYAKSGLPGHLQLGLQSPRRESLLGLLGLLEGQSYGEAVPLSLAGAGTKRLAAFELAAVLGADAQIVLIDEPEVGLEPYRQRRLLTRLRELVAPNGQAFLTTHSPAVLAGISSSEIVRLARGRGPLRLPQKVLDKLVRDDPEALLARLAVLCEGRTEAGALTELLRHVGSLGDPADLDALGIRLVARTGQPAMLSESEALANAGVAHGVFADSENEHSGTRARLRDNPFVAFGTWQDVRNIEEAVATWLPDEHIEMLFGLAAEVKECSLDSLRQTVGERANRPGSLPFAALVAAVGREQARAALGRAMNAGSWFKTETKGAALGRFLVRIGLPAQIEEVVAEFWVRLKSLL